MLESIVGVILALLGVLLLLPNPNVSKVPKFKTDAERIAWEKEQSKIEKQRRLDEKKQWLVERARRMRLEGLNPENPTDVKKWKSARRAEKKAEDEKRRALAAAKEIIIFSEPIHYEGSASDIKFEERERMLDTIRSERKYLSDEEIRDRHQGSWGRGETDGAFKEIDKKSFLGDLFFG